jgi:hypothetical protein
MEIPDDVWYVIINLISSYRQLKSLRNVSTMFRQIIDTSNRYLELDEPSRKIFRQLPIYDWNNLIHVKIVRDFKDPDRQFKYVVVKLTLLDKEYIVDNSYNKVKHIYQKFHFLMDHCMNPKNNWYLSDVGEAVYQNDLEICDYIKRYNPKCTSMKKYRRATRPRHNKITRLNNRINKMLIQ